MNHTNNDEDYAPSDTDSYTSESHSEEGYNSQSRSSTSTKSNTQRSKLSAEQKKLRNEKIKTITTILQKLKKGGLHKSERTDLTNQLRQHCISRHGLISKELRQKSWPLIFGIDCQKLPSKPNRALVRENQWFNQVKLDVDRSVSRIEKGLPKNQQEVLQENLTDLILHILVRNPELHYYQGYHDIAITILQVCGLRLAMPVVEKLTKDYLRDFMQKTMDSTKVVLEMIFPLISDMDPVLHEFLEESEVGSYFALSWLLTWYGHVMKDLKRTSRIYDFFIASHPAMPIYLAAEIILHRREEILATECDMPSVHHLLTSLASTELPDDELIENAVRVFVEKPPSSLPIEHEELSFYKQLFMARATERSSTLHHAVDQASPDSSTTFIQHRRYLNEQKYKMMNSSPGGGGRGYLRTLVTTVTGGAVAVAIISFWLNNYINKSL